MHKDPDVLAEFEGRLVGGQIATCAMVRLELLWSTRDADEIRGRRARLGALDEIPIGPAVWSHYDADFELIAGVTGQPVRAIAPLGSL